MNFATVETPNIIIAPISIPIDLPCPCAFSPAEPKILLSPSNAIEITIAIPPTICNTPKTLLIIEFALVLLVISGL